MKTKIIYIVILIIVIIYFIPAKQADFFEIYSKNDVAAQNLKEFYKYPIKTLTTNGVTWNYISVGEGKKTILFLHGMGGAYDLWWQQINEFKDVYKVISYTLPEEIDNLAATLKGIQEILNKENVTNFTAVGTSMGGYITQYLVKTMPNRLEKVVFGNTFPPNDEIIKKNKKQSILVRLLPEIVISKFGEKKLHKELLPAGKNNALLTAFLPSLPFSKKGFIGRYKVVTDFFTLNPTKHVYKKIPKLIIESDNDPLISPNLRKELKALYTDATVFTFHNEGHFPYINAAKKYNEILKNFLKKENGSMGAKNTVTH